MESETATLDDSPADGARMSFGDHLDELRRCLIRAILGIVLGAIVSFWFGQELLEIIYRPLLIVQYANGLQPSLQVLSPTAAFVAYLKIGFLGGMILAGPWVIYQLWIFVASGLYSHEQRFVRLLVPTSVGLFATGVMFLYFIVLPIVLNFFITFNKAFDAPSLQPSWLQRALMDEEEPVKKTAPVSNGAKLPILEEAPSNPALGQVWVDPNSRRLIVKTNKGLLSVPMEVGKEPQTMHSQFALDFYVSFVLMLTLAFGVAFETPLVVFFLAWTGLVSVASMSKARRYVIMGAVVLSAMITPPDVISQVLLATPMYLLYELGLLVARVTIERRRLGAESA